VQTSWRVEPMVDETTAYTILAEDRIWNGYSIADLDPPFRAYTRVALARHAAAAPAACLFLCHPAFSSIIPHGPAAGIAAILAQVDLPETTFLLARPAHLPIFQHHYDCANGDQMLRMAVSAATFRAPNMVLHPVRHLEERDLPALRRLYAAYPGNAFNDDQLIHGVFYGIRDGDDLVAAGGTHALSRRNHIAAIGNIFTHPGHRGRGLGGAIVAALVADLLGFCQDVVLNVSTTNAAARHVYERLGFRTHCDYWEGDIRRRNTNQHLAASDA
jgi:ribosomal protein S18 acetylase RimI-like enzyme